MFSLTKTSASDLRSFYDYLHTWIVAVALAANLYVGMAILRAHGIAHLSSIFQAVYAATAIVLDLVLVFKVTFLPALGFLGIIVANLAGFALSGAAITIFLARKKLLSSDSWFSRSGALDILSVGFLSTVSNSV